MKQQIKDKIKIINISKNLINIAPYMFSLIAIILQLTVVVILEMQMEVYCNEIQDPFYFSILPLMMTVILVVFINFYSNIVENIVVYLFLVLEIILVAIEIFFMNIEFGFLKVATFCYIWSIFFNLEAFIIKTNKTKGDK